MAALLLAGQRTLRAADHLEAPNAAGGQDLSDVYAWMDADGENLNLIMNLVGGEFDTETQYVFHVHSGDGFQQTDNTPTDIICQFAAADNVECWVGDPENGGVFVTGDATKADEPLTDGNDQVKVFAGARNDPFYFNITGFGSALELVNAAAGGITLDANGCPQVDPATAGALRDMLTVGVDDFAGMNVASLVVQVKKTQVNVNGDTLAVWASTHNKP